MASRAALLTAGLFLSTAAAGAAPRTVSIKTADGQSLAATHSASSGRPVVIMLHGLGSTKEEWRPFAEALEASGWGTLAYDARGHGGSASVTGTRDRWVDDVGAAIRFIQDADGIQRSSIVVVGASLGANVAARYAALAAAPKAVVLLSPGLDYAGFKPLADMPKIACPVLIVVSDKDSYSFSSSPKLKGAARNAVLWSDVPPGHGVQMFAPGLIQRVREWMERAK